jgi:hypothetical protein
MLGRTPQVGVTWGLPGCAAVIVGVSRLVEASNSNNARINIKTISKLFGRLIEGVYSLVI